MLQKHSFTIDGADGHPIRGDVRLDAGDGPRPVAVVLHGFKGFKDWGWFPWIAERLAAAGFAAVSVNLSHGGVGDRPMEFDRLDLFEAATWSKALFDLAAVTDVISGGSLPGAEAFDPTRIAILGHSLGGAQAVLHAARDERVRAVVGLAPVSHCERFTPEQVEIIDREGGLDIPNARTGQVMRVGRPWVEDVRVNRSALDVEAAARSLRIPLLVVHGENDSAVPVAEGRALAEWAPGARFEPIANSGHTFESGHPFGGPTGPLERAVEMATAFLGGYFFASSS